MTTLTLKGYQITTGDQLAEYDGATVTKVTLPDAPAVVVTAALRYPNGDTIHAYWGREADLTVMLPDRCYCGADHNRPL